MTPVYDFFAFWLHSGIRITSKVNFDHDFDAHIARINRIEAAYQVEHKLMTKELYTEDQQFFERNANNHPERRFFLVTRTTRVKIQLWGENQERDDEQDRTERHAESAVYCAKVVRRGTSEHMMRLNCFWSACILTYPLAYLQYQVHASLEQVAVRNILVLYLYQDNKGSLIETKDSVLANLLEKVSRLRAAQSYRQCTSCSSTIFYLLARALIHPEDSKSPVWGVLSSYLLGHSSYGACHWDDFGMSA